MMSLMLSLSLSSDFVLIPLYLLYPRNLKPLLKLVSLVLSSLSFIASFSSMISLTHDKAAGSSSLVFVMTTKSSA